MLIRHGQSTWNSEHRWQGQADPELSDIGRQQARVAAKSIGNVDAVVSSTLVRAFQTAEIISGEIGVGPVHQLAEIIERDVGEWSGLTRDQIQTNWPDWETSGYRPEGWEPDSKFLARVLTGFLMLSKRFGDADLLVVAHSGLIMTLERHFGADRGRIPNLGGVRVDVSDDDVTVLERVKFLDEDLITGGGSL